MSTNTGMSQAQIKMLSKNLSGLLLKMDDPPADELYVDINSIKPTGERTYSATAKIIVHYPGVKPSYADFVFKVDDLGRAIPNSITYAACKN